MLVHPCQQFRRGCKEKMKSSFEEKSYVAQTPSWSTASLLSAHVIGKGSVHTATSALCWSSPGFVPLTVGPMVRKDAISRTKIIVILFDISSSGRLV